MKSEKWLSIRQVAIRVGAGENSVRRYLKRFHNFFAPKKVGSRYRYPMEAIDMLSFIHKLYREGKNTKEIENILGTDYQQGVAVPDEGNEAQHILSDFGPSAKDMIRDAIKGGIVEALSSLTGHSKDVSDLKNELATVKKQLSELLSKGQPSKKEGKKAAPQEEKKIPKKRGRKPKSEKAAEKPHARRGRPRSTRKGSSGIKQELRQRVLSMKEDEKMSFSEIARRFNEEEVVTITGRGVWHDMQVARLYREGVKEKEESLKQKEEGPKEKKENGQQ